MYCTHEGSNQINDHHSQDVAYISDISPAGRKSLRVAQVSGEFVQFVLLSWEGGQGAVRRTPGPLYIYSVH